jgi:hypothetical protein
MSESSPSSVDKNTQPVTEDIGPQVSEQCAAGEDVQGEGSPKETEKSESETSEQFATDEDAQVSDTGISKTVKTVATSVDGKQAKTRKKKRKPNKEAAERRLLGRQAMCKRIDDLAPHMLKTVKSHVCLQSKWRICIVSRLGRTLDGESAVCRAIRHKRVFISPRAIVLFLCQQRMLRA